MPSLIDRQNSKIVGEHYDFRLKSQFPKEYHALIPKSSTQIIPPYKIGLEKVGIEVSSEDLEPEKTGDNTLKSKFHSLIFVD